MNFLTVLYVECKRRAEIKKNDSMVCGLSKWRRIDICLLGKVAEVVRKEVYMGRGVIMNCKLTLNMLNLRWL